MKTPYERLRGRPYQGQPAEFAVVVHFRDPQTAADMPKLDDRWNLGLLLGKSLASVGALRWNIGQGCAGVDPSGHAQRTKRWDRKMLSEMNG